MSNALTTAAATALRQTAEASPRLGAAGGLGSPGAVAGQFAAMLASLRDGAGDASSDPATIGVSQPFGSIAASAPNDGGEHKVALSAVSLLLQDLGAAGSAQQETDATTPRRGEAPADVSMEVVARSIASGAPADGRWMATLMATGQGMETASA